MFHFKPQSVRALITLICIFVMLDFSVLGMNYWLSILLEEDALEINLAGRQRMLSQAISKDVLLLKNMSLVGDLSSVPETALRLKASSELFDRTLMAFAKGGLTEGATGEEVTIRPVRTGVQQDVVHRALQLWRPWLMEIETVLKSPAEASRFQSLLNITLKNNYQLLQEMNTLTVSLEDSSQRTAHHIRIYQSATLILVLLNFAYIIRHFFSQLALSRSSQEVLDKLINSVEASIVVEDENGIVGCNDYAEKIFRKSQQQILGQRLKFYLAKDKDCYRVIREPEFHGESPMFVAVEKGTVNLNDRVFDIYTITDISKQKETENYLAKLAYVDPLTGVYNRQLFEDRIKSEIKRASRGEDKFSLLYLDLDDFKRVNDQYGHEVGDEALKIISETIKGSLRSTDIIGRVGGDEFLVLCPGSSRDLTSKLAEKLIANIEQVTEAKGRPISIGLSIGIASYPENGRDSDSLKQKADFAMYQAKQSGKNKYAYAEY